MGTRRLQRGRGLQPNGGSTPTTLGTACAKVGHRCSREGCAKLGWRQAVDHAHCFPLLHWIQGSWCRIGRYGCPRTKEYPIPHRHQFHGLFRRAEWPEGCQGSRGERAGCYLPPCLCRDLQRSFYHEPGERQVHRQQHLRRWWLCGNCGPRWPWGLGLDGCGTHILGKDTRAAMTWFPSDHCYEMYLDKSIGNSLGWYIFKNLGPMLSEACHTTDKSSVHWAIHPGGKAILEGLEKVGVSKADLQQSRNILEQYGNMSSATILFVLQASMADPTMQKDRLFSLAFGPGLTIETVGLTKLLDTSSMSDASSDASS